MQNWTEISCPETGFNKTFPVNPDIVFFTVCSEKKIQTQKTQTVPTSHPKEGV